MTGEAGRSTTPMCSCGHPEDAHDRQGCWGWPDGSACPPALCQGPDAEGRTPSPDLRCPVCLDPISVILEYVPGSYSEHRDHKGYECDNFRCRAEWDQFGRNTVPSHIGGDT